MGYFLLQLLHTTLSEMAFSGGVRFAYGIERLELTDTNQRHVRRYVCAYLIYLFCDSSHWMYGVI